MPVIEAWQLCVLVLVNEVWPLCLLVPIKEVWLLCVLVFIQKGSVCVSYHAVYVVL